MSDNYDPQRIRNRYDSLGEEEWSRLDSTPKGKISFLTHMRFIEKYVQSGDCALEAGAGAGRFTIELLKLGTKVTVLDLSAEQLKFNEMKVREMNLEGGISERIQGDICDLSRFSDGQFDVVVCYGGPLSYVFDKRDLAMKEMLRVLKPGGYLLLSVMSLIGTIRHFFALTIEWSIEHGISDWKKIVETRDMTGEIGSEDHWLRFYCASDLREFLETFDCTVLEMAASNSLTNFRNNYLDTVKMNTEVWDMLVKTEMNFCMEPGNIDSGEHIIAVVRKN